MEEHIKQLATEYALNITGNSNIAKHVAVDFEAGIKMVLAHPEEFGLTEKLN